MFKGRKIHFYNILFIPNYAFLLVDNRFFFLREMAAAVQYLVLKDRLISIKT